MTVSRLALAAVFALVMSQTLAVQHDHADHEHTGSCVVCSQTDETPVIDTGVNETLTPGFVPSWASDRIEPAYSGERQPYHARAPPPA